MGRNSAELLRRLAEGPPIISDGGMGAQLLLRGWQGPTEDANLHAPETVEEIHRAFVSAGAELILTNTFMVPTRRWEAIPELVTAAVTRARAAAPDAFIVGSVGPASDWPIGLLEVLGRAFAENAVDGVTAETLDENGPGLRRLRNFFLGGGLPFVTSFLARENFAGLPQGTRTFFGLNCGDGPASVLHAARSSPGVASLRPSAGIPTGEGRSLQWPVRPAAFGDFAEEAAALGARIIGGCCGASPDHIAAIADRLRSTR